MGKFIPVEPEKWAEMVKAMAENARLKAEVEELTGLLKASTYYNTSDEVTRLKAEVERLTKHEDDTCRHYIMRLLLESQNARFKAEVERLTKAGDSMAARLIYQGYPETVPAWNAAKEGKQP